jgi:hypothetical protein
MTRPMMMIMTYSEDLSNGRALAGRAPRRTGSG